MPDRPTCHEGRSAMTAVQHSEFDAILRSDFQAFAQKCFVDLNPGAVWKANWHIDAICHHLECVRTGTLTRLIINMPPRALKSHIGSIAFPAFGLGLDSARKIICASYSQDLAAKHASDFRRVMESEWYKRVFRTGSLAKNTEAEVQTVAGGFRLATSVGGTLTGRGGDILIVDDPLNAAEAHSKPAREKVNTWFASTLLSRLDDKQKGAIVVIMQRLHPDDLTGFLLEQGGWTMLSLPAIAPHRQEVPTGKDRAHLWREGEPLHAAREPLAVLDQIKRQLGADTFNAQYLQAPLPDGGNLLKRDWLLTFEVPPHKQPGDRIVQSWDTAMKASDTSDYSVCLTFLVRNNNRYHLLDVARERLEFPELVKRVLAHARSFQAGAILIEDSASGTSLIQTVRKAGLQGVIGIKPIADKPTRMYGQTPKLEAGSLLLPKAAPWLGEFLAEYLAFPKAKHDDQIDALSQFLIWQGTQEDDVFSFDFGYDEDPRHPSFIPSGEQILGWRGIY
jgi:predicted phage terminase large subunit-like protein